MQPRIQHPDPLHRGSFNVRGQSDGTPPRLLERAPTLTDVGNASGFAASDQAAAITATAINLTCGAEID